MNPAADIYQYADDKTRTRILNEYGLQWGDLIDAQRRQPGWNTWLETGQPTTNAPSPPSQNPEKPLNATSPTPPDAPPSTSSQTASKTHSDPTAALVFDYKTEKPAKPSLQLVTANTATTADPAS